MKAIGGVRLERRPGKQGWIQRRGAALTAAAVLALFAAYALLLGRGAAWLDAGSLHGLTAIQRSSEIDTMRGYLIQVGAGVLAAGALLYTALNFQLAREGHVTDRYTKAIEQLGSDRLDVRLGAIYALERIMIDSVRDHPTIVEVLAAFVREHAPTPPSNPGTGGPQAGQLPFHLATDVQAALTVLGRRPVGRDERGSVNLTGANLVGANLTRANLAGATLNNADLTHAYLGGANLGGAHLNGTNLTHAYLNHHANLVRASLIGANLTDANLTNADLTGAVLINANLTNANFTRANLTDANLQGAKLPDAKLAEAGLIRANLTGAVLTDANLTGAELIGATLTHVDFTGADLTGADLTDAVGADLTDSQRSGLNQARLRLRPPAYLSEAGEGSRS